MTVIPDTNTKMAGLSGTYEQKVTYTADGQVASTTYPAAGGLSKETVTTHFDEETSVAEWMGGGFGWGTYVASSRTDVFGRLSYLDLGNTYGTVVSYGYEVGTDRLMNVKLDRERIGGTELDISYAYDDAGNVLSAKDKPTAAGRAADQQCYQYDALRHLTEAWTPATGNCALAKSPAALGGSAPYWASFQYDDVLGNRTDETYRTRGLAGDVDGGVTTTRGYDYEGSRDLNGNGNSTDAGEFAGPHAVTSITTDGPSGSTGTSFTYDNAGRTRTQTQDSDYLTSKLSLSWDHESELASTTTAKTVYPEPEPGSGDDDSDGDQSSGTGPDRGTGTTVTISGRNLYTADGDRLVRTAPDGSITVYLGGQEITKAANGAISGARYYSFGGQTVAMRTANGLGGVTSLVNDPHGTPLASVHNTNWTTTSVDKHYTLPFGEQRGGDSAPGDHEFLGKVRDDATGLTLVGARWYDETVGRFLSVDPRMDLTDPRTWNGYAYANSSPVTYSDPSGLSWWDSLKSAAKSFVSGMAGAFVGSAMRDINHVVNTVKSIPSAIRASAASAHSTTRGCAGGSGAACGSVLNAAIQGAVSLFKVLPTPASMVLSTMDAGEEGLARGQRMTGNTASAIVAAVHGDWAGAGAGFGQNSWEQAKFAGETAVAAAGAFGGVSIAKTAGRTALDALDTVPARVPASEIRFSQRTVGAGVSAREAAMRSGGWTGDPLDVVRMPDGGLTSVDNRRLLAAKRAGIEARVFIHEFDDPIPLEHADRMKTKKGVLPTTWGEAVMNRMTGQGAKYRKAWPNGSPRTGWEGN